MTPPREAVPVTLWREGDEFYESPSCADGMEQYRALPAASFDARERRVGELEKALSKAARYLHEPSLFSRDKLDGLVAHIDTLLGARDE